MADVTISELAGVVGVSVDKLLSQVKEAGLPHTKADELISNDDKNILLVFLRRSHGDRDASSAAPKKITLKRKTLGTLKSASSAGRGKTVNVEVRKKRTYVKRSAIETPAEEDLPAAELESEVQETTAEAVAPEVPAVEEAEKEAVEVKPDTAPPGAQAAARRTFPDPSARRITAACIGCCSPGPLPRGVVCDAGACVEKYAVHARMHDETA